MTAVTNEPEKHLQKHVNRKTLSPTKDALYVELVAHGIPRKAPRERARNGPGDVERDKDSRAAADVARPHAAGSTSADLALAASTNCTPTLLVTASKAYGPHTSRPSVGCRPRDEGMTDTRRHPPRRLLATPAASVPAHPVAR